MLNEINLFEKIDKVKIAIERLRQFEPDEGYYLAFSGGKDSCVIKALAEMADVKYESHYNMTTIDPPELVQFIRDYHRDVKMNKPERSFFVEMRKRGFPTRRSRWCCEVFKERGGDGRLVATGVRRSESKKREGRRMIESCIRGAQKKYINVIVDWSDADVWEFIRAARIEYCKLYDEGFKRIGCLLCPCAGAHRKIEAERYPKFTKAFILNFEKLYERRKKEGAASVARWRSGEEMFEWWMNPGREKFDYDQSVMFE